MNKLLILILFLFIFSMKINAYEYVIQDYIHPTTGVITYKFFTDTSGRLHLMQLRQNGESYINDSDIWISFQRIKFGGGTNYVTKNVFDRYYENNLLFMNDLYTYFTQEILNYFYTNIPFAGNNRVQYENYQLLYNSDGLAVESIVNGEWAGAYPQYESGKLYNKSGDLLYNNGVEVSYIEKLGSKILKPIKKSLQSSFGLKIWYSLLAVIFVMAMLRFIIRQAFKAFLIKFYTRQMDRLQKRREKIENA